MRHKCAKVLVCFLTLALTLFVLPGAWAQSILTGGVSGVISDDSGARMPGATVTLKSAETGSEYKTVSNSSGAYSISLVKPGNYTLTVEKDKFKTISQAVNVGVGQVVAGNYTMAVGMASETIEVTATTPILQTENANLATTYNAAQIEKMPNPGNDLTAIANTAPGVLMSTGGGYGNFNAFGLPATSNLFTVNGSDEMDPYLNLNNSGATNLLLGTNEVEEVAVVSNGYTAQYGRQAGAQVDYVTKSGTNAFHGNAVYYWNGRWMNANEWFANNTNTPRPFANNNQWAARLGGPIIKDKAFFFVDTEGLRYILSTSALTIVPTAAFANTVLTNLPANGFPASVPFYQNIFNLYLNAPGINRAVPVNGIVDTTLNLGCGDLNTTGGSGAVVPGFAQFGGFDPSHGTNPQFANAAYGTNLGGGTPCAQSFRSTVGNVSHEWILAGRVDYNINDHSRVNLRYRMDRGLQPTITDPISPIFNASSTQPAYEGQINYNTSFSPTVFNQFIVSGSWYSAIFGKEALAAQATFPGRLVDFDTSSWADMGGDNSAFPQGRKVTQYGVVDDVSWTFGPHTFKFGGNFRRNDVTDEGNLIRTIPRLRSFSKTDFATGLVDQISQRFPVRGSNPLALYSVGAYVQDEWRATKNLKFTMALRLDRNSNPLCQTDCFARLVTGFNDLNHDPNIPFNQMIANNLKRAFPKLEAVSVQPRVGLAWQPPFARNMVIRGGIGLFSDLYPAFLADSFMHNAPQLTQFTITSGLPLSTAEVGNAYAAEQFSNNAFRSAFVNGGTVASYCAVVKGAGLPCRLPDYNDIGKVTNPRFMQYNLEIQQSFGPKTVLSVNYVGNQGFDLFTSSSFLNSFSKSGFGGLRTTAVDSRVANVTLFSTNGESNYNGITGSLTHRFGGGITGRVNYTWSHSLDDISNGGLAEPYNINDSLTGQLNPAGLRVVNYSHADYDARHLVSGNYVWELPFKPSGTFLKEVLGGWAFAGTLVYRTGTPYSVVDTAGNSTLFRNGVNTPAFLVNGSNPTRCTDPMTCSLLASAPSGFATQPRNSFRGPSFFDTDLQVSKQFRLTERMSFTGGVNFFNLLNHPNFANPINDIASGQFGTIQTTVAAPTSPYGSFVGAANGRLIQLMGRITF